MQVLHIIDLKLYILSLRIPYILQECIGIVIGNQTFLYAGVLYQLFCLFGRNIIKFHFKISEIGTGIAQHQILKGLCDG